MEWLSMKEGPKASDGDTKGRVFYLFKDDSALLLQIDSISLFGPPIAWCRSPYNSFNEPETASSTHKPFTKAKEVHPYWDVKVRSLRDGSIFRIDGLRDAHVFIESTWYSFEFAFKMFRFENGKPFGVPNEG